MTLEKLKPTLPDYLVQAVNDASAAMKEASNIFAARSEVRESLEEIAQAIAAAEAELGDLEAESRLRRKPDPAKTTQLEEKLDKLRAEQTKLIATQKSLEQRSQQQDEAVVSAYGSLNSARRKLGLSLLTVLNDALEEAVQPLQDVLDIVRAINNFVDFNEYSYPLMEAVVPCFGGNRHLINHGAHYAQGSMPRQSCEMAGQWTEALAAANQTLSDIMPVSERCRHAIENRKEKAADERMRADRLQLRVI